MPTHVMGSGCMSACLHMLWALAACLSQAAYAMGSGCIPTHAMGPGCVSKHAMGSGYMSTHARELVAEFTKREVGRNFQLLACPKVPAHKHGWKDRIAMEVRAEGRPDHMFRALVFVVLEDLVRHLVEELENLLIWVGFRHSDDLHGKAHLITCPSATDQG